MESAPAVCLVAALAVAACSPARPDPRPVQVDRVMTPPVAASASVLAPERLTVEGAARWETTTVGDLTRRRAVTDDEREEAERLLASGAYLGDAARVLALTPAGATDRFRSGAAYLSGAFPREAPPGPFDLSVTFDLAGDAGASAGLTVELRDPGSEATGEVGQLLVTLMDPGVGTPARLTVSTRGAGPEAAFEPVGSASLEARDWRGAHRITLGYTPGQLVASLDGEPLVAADVRLDRPAGPVYVGAFAPAPTMGVSLLEWTFASR